MLQITAPSRTLAWRMLDACMVLLPAVLLTVGTLIIVYFFWYVAWLDDEQALKYSVSGLLWVAQNMWLLGFGLIALLLSWFCWRRRWRLLLHLHDILPYHLDGNDVTPAMHSFRAWRELRRREKGY